MEATDDLKWYDVRLIWPLNYLPSIFRFLALVYIAPVIILSVFDVGGYLLFKIFYKPFGNYPMYSYFKQAPPREDFKNKRKLTKKTLEGQRGTTSECFRASRSSSSSLSLSSEASSTLTSSIIPPPPTISIDSNNIDDITNTSRSSFSNDDHHLRLRINSSSNKKSSKKSFNHRQFDHTIGFDGPMLDCKSPTASDYEE